MAAASGAGSRPPPAARLATRAIRTRPEDTLARVFGRIDHIGVAVADLESAIELHTRAYGMPLVHRETIAEQGVEAVLLDVGESHVELLSPLERGLARRALPGHARARVCITSPTRWRMSRPRSARRARRGCG